MLHSVMQLQTVLCSHNRLWLPYTVEPSKLG
jgi:hypothetical protein